MYNGYDNETTLSSVVLPTTTNDITIVYANMVTSDTDCNLYYGTDSTAVQKLILDSEGSNNQLQSFNQFFIPSGNAIRLTKILASRKCSGGFTYIDGNLASSTASTTGTTITEITDTNLLNIKQTNEWILTAILVIVTISIIDISRRVLTKTRYD